MIKVFANEKYATEKAAALAARWAGVEDTALVVSQRAHTVSLAQAHFPSWVVEVLRQDHAQGEVALHAVGALAEAAVCAWSEKKTTCVTTEGGSLAGVDFASKTEFNALVVAARTVLAKGADRVSIFDASRSRAEGTQDILRRKMLPEISHYSVANFFNVREEAATFLDLLPMLIKAVCRSSELLIYQAGAGVHEHDDTGGWLTKEQMRQRDNTVFGVARDIGLPVVWCPEGGAQALARVLDLHTQTLEEAIKFAS